MVRRVWWLGVVTWVGLGVGEAEAQEQGGGADEAAVRVYVDCQTGGCDQEFFRSEMDYLDWMRDREDADVHILVTSQQTGAGGRRYTLRFIGRGAFEGGESSLETDTRQDATREDRRSALARTIALGLVPYLAQTPLAERLSLRYQAPDGSERSVATSSEEDPWNFWVFTLSGRGFFRGQSASTSQDLNSSVAANRTTEDLKVRLGVNLNYSENEFDLSDGLFTTIERNFAFDGLVAWSLGDHWATGPQVTASSSTFTNQRSLLRFAPTLEYNLFPYSESTSRELTFAYQVAASQVDYFEETIFEETSETILDHKLRTTLDVKEPWGSVSVSLEGATFLDDFDKNRVSLFGNANFRLVRGLSLDLFGSYSRVRDQVFLSRAGASDEDVLLRLRQLQTDFTYFASVGIRYSFGSIFNNVVNTRMENLGGNFFFF